MLSGSNIPLLTGNNIIILKPVCSICCSSSRLINKLHLLYYTYIYSYSLYRVELCRQDNRVLRSFSLSQCEGGPHEFRGVRRSSLTEALTAQLLPGTVIYNTPITGASTPRSTPSPSSATSTTVASSGVVLKTGSGEELHCVAAVGADGVRGGLIAAAGRRPARYVGQVAIRGVAEIPGGNLPCECIRQVWSVGPRAGMYPISGW